MALIFTAHARHRMTLRAITEAWVAATSEQPELTSRDPRDPALTRAWRRIPKHDGRVLRVVFRRDGSDIVMVSTVFDRGRADGCHDLWPRRRRAPCRPGTRRRWARN